MNSALQCMSNTPVLTDYFLADMHINDINRDNPLGMHGEIAESYANLIKAMWSGSHTAHALKTFKQKVCSFALRKISLLAIHLHYVTLESQDFLENIFEFPWKSI